MNYLKSLCIYILILSFGACATYKPQYANEKDKENSFPNKEIDKIFYLVGDAGLSPQGEMSLALTAYSKHIEGKKTKGDYTLFLGDNIYPAGLPKKSDKRRSSAEDAINAQSKSVKDFQGKTIFIPGNHDWYADGLKGLKREEKYIEDLLGKNTFLPEDGCPLKSIDVSETIQLIIIDTQWYLTYHNRYSMVFRKLESSPND